MERRLKAGERVRVKFNKDDKHWVYGYVFKGYNVKVSTSYIVGFSVTSEPIECALCESTEKEPSSEIDADKLLLKNKRVKVQFVRHGEWFHGYKFIRYAFDLNPPAFVVMADSDIAQYQYYCFNCVVEDK